MKMSFKKIWFILFGTTKQYYIKLLLPELEIIQIVTLDGLAQTKAILCVSVANETLFTLRHAFDHLDTIFNLSKISTVITDKEFPREGL